MANIASKLPSNSFSSLLDATKQNISMNIKVADVVVINEILSDDDGDGVYTPESEGGGGTLSGWTERTNSSGIKYGEQSATYYWDVSNNPNATFANCMPNCTTYAYGRVLEAGCEAPVSPIVNAGLWHNNLVNSWEAVSYNQSDVCIGDILEWSRTVDGVTEGHVAVVENINPIMISASDYTDSSCGWPLAGNRTPGYWGGSPYIINSLSTICSWLSSKAPTRFFRYWSFNSENNRVGYNPAYILRNPGSFFDNSRKTFICKSITNGLNLTCKAINGIKLAQHDTVVVVFTDVDYRSNLAKAKKGEQTTNVNMDTTYHDSSYGIIIGKL